MISFKNLVKYAIYSCTELCQNVVILCEEIFHALLTQEHVHATHKNKAKLLHWKLAQKFHPSTRKKESSMKILDLASPGFHKKGEAWQ